MSDANEYSFHTKITNDGCIYIPEEILKNLGIGQSVRVSIIPNRAKTRETTIKLDDYDITFRILRYKDEIFRRLKETVAIDEDYRFLMWYYSPHNKHEHLEIHQLVGVLMKLYGEPDTFYDDYKCSFNYTFDFIITYKNEEPIREVNLVLTIFDYKDSLYMEFRRPREGSDDRIIKLIEDVVKRKDLNKCIIVMHNYFAGFFEGYGNNPYNKFERYQPYSRMRYGYNGTEFYLTYEEEEEE